MIEAIEVNNMEARITELEKELATFYSLRELHAKDGKIDVELNTSKEVACAMVACFRPLLKDAENYVECHINGEEGKEFILTVQRASKPTPHQLREKAELELRKHMIHHNHINPLLDDADEAAKMLNAFEARSEWFDYDGTFVDAIRKLIDKIEEDARTK